jgi:hypothetical protein
MILFKILVIHVHLQPHRCNTDYCRRYKLSYNITYALLTNRGEKRKGRKINRKQKERQKYNEKTNCIFDLCITASPTYLPTKKHGCPTEGWSSPSFPSEVTSINLILY